MKNQKNGFAATSTPVAFGLFMRANHSWVPDQSLHEYWWALNDGAIVHFHSN